MTKSVADDVAMIARIDAVPSILEIACRATGLRFAAVARVTETTWTACAVRDEIDFGLVAGGELKLETTICDEIRNCGKGVIIDHVAKDEHFRDHHTPRMYGFESYISIPIIRSDGSFFGTLCALDPLPARVSDTKTVTMFESFATLISLQLDVQDRLAASQTALGAAHDNATVREQFIAVLGHDLRNPVAAIEAGTHLLKNGPLDPRSTRIVDQMRQSCQRITGLIEDLLDFARGRLGAGLVLNRDHADNLGTRIRHAVAELEIVHPERQVDLDIRLSEPVNCDVERVAQLVSNLLGNALTHGALDQPVRVEASTTGGKFIVSIANGGTPIPAAALEGLFQPFTRAAASQSPAGLGLGLFIASEIAKAHGGTLEVRSDELETRFTLTIPA